MAGSDDNRKPPKPLLTLAINNAEEVAAPPEPASTVASGASGAAGGNAKTGAPAAGNGDGSTGEAPKWTAEGLPPDCPVIPLGQDGKTCYYLDSDMHLIELGASEHTRLFIMRMFGHQTDFLYKHWPRNTPEYDKPYGKDRKIIRWNTTGWRPEAVAECLSAACSRRGDWDAFKKVRGPGAWRADDGGLIIHCGDVILAGGAKHVPGFIEGFVYPRRPALPRPWPHAVRAGDDGPGAFLSGLFRTWNWRRGDLDVTLLIGAIACAMIGGALPWRPMPWITGGSGTGKSTLKRCIEDLFAGRLIGCEDPSPAGIWQKLGHATLPVAIDEHEPEEGDNKRGNAIVKLARMAASGAMMLRGGADHQGTEFVIRSVFMFFSILVPSLLPQDRNRMAILSLAPLRAEAAPAMKPVKMREVGQQVLRRLIDQWPQWDAVHAIFHSRLLAEKLPARTADLYAALLTGAELIMSDDHEGLGEAAATIALQIAAGHVDESGDELSDDKGCLRYLLTSMVPLETGAVRRPVSEVVRRTMLGEPHADHVREGRALLSNYGMKVVEYRVGEERFLFLAVADKHRELAKIFAGSVWASRAGMTGVWKQSLGRLPRADRSRQPVWFTGGNCRATLVPMACIFPPDGKPEDAQAALDATAVALESDG